MYACHQEYALTYLIRIKYADSF